MINERRSDNKDQDTPILTTHPEIAKASTIQGVAKAPSSQDVGREAKTIQDVGNAGAHIDVGKAMGAIEEVGKAAPAQDLGI